MVSSTPRTISLLYACWMCIVGLAGTSPASFATTAALAENALPVQALKDAKPACICATSALAPLRTLEEAHGGARGETHPVEHHKCLDLKDEQAMRECNAKQVRKVVPAFLYSLSVLMFVVSSMWLLLVTKWKDAEVRRSVFHMISTTVSIFCAVVINKLIFDAVHYLLHRSSMELTEVLVLCTFFGLYFLYHVTSNTIATMARPKKYDWKMAAFVASSIGAHLKGFAAIAAFGELQHLYFSASVTEAAKLVAIAWSVLSVVQLISFYLPCIGRKACLESDEDVSSDKLHRTESLNSLSRRKSLDEEQEEWSEQMEEADDDSAGLCIGFLMMQVVRLQVVGKLGPVEEEGDSIFGSSERLTFHYFEAGFGILLVMTGFVRTYLEWKPLYGYLVEQDAKKQVIARAAKAFHGAICMALGWTIFKHGDWFWRSVFNDVLNPEVVGEVRPDPPDSILLMARMVNASYLTCLCVLIVISLDFIIDVSNPKTTKNAFTKLKLSCDPRTLSGGHLATQTIEEFWQDFEHTDRKNIITNLLRKLIDATGFLVGICWEKAMSQANSIFAERFFELTKHVDQEMLSENHFVLGRVVEIFSLSPLLSKCIIGAITVTAVLVVWYKHLVPYARIHVFQHIYLQIAEEFVCSGMSNPNISACHAALCQMMFPNPTVPGDSEAKCENLMYDREVFRRVTCGRCLRNPHGQGEGFSISQACSGPGWETLDEHSCKACKDLRQRVDDAVRQAAGLRRRAPTGTQNIYHPTGRSRELEILEPVIVEGRADIHTSHSTPRVERQPLNG